MNLYIDNDVALTLYVLIVLPTISLSHQRGVDISRYGGLAKRVGPTVILNHAEAVKRVNQIVLKIACRRNANRTEKREKRTGKQYN